MAGLEAQTPTALRAEMPISVTLCFFHTPCGSRLRVQTCHSWRGFDGGLSLPRSPSFRTYSKASAISLSKSCGKLKCAAAAERGSRLVGVMPGIVLISSV